jgi:radical SAM superfamily enzyme YgiQ (UPF0313 family)
MANLGYHYVYRKLREMRVASERFFVSPVPYRSVEADTLLERFRLIMAGVSYEGDVPSFAKWLFEGGVEPSRVYRDEGAPVVGAGGAMTYINPLSLSGISDFIVLGDGLPVLGYVVETLRQGGPREVILSRLAEHQSILVPSVHLDSGGAFCLRVSKQPNLALDYGHGNWVTTRSVFGDTFLVELQRGCARGCRYCTLPSCFGPLRQRSPQSVLNDIKEATGVAVFGQVGFVTPEAGDYRGLDELLEGVGALGKGVSFASLRVDGLSRKIIKILARDRHSITIAPETGDDALRFSCGKNFTNDKVIEVLAIAKGEGIKNVKLYFMIGLPDENDAHVLSIAELCGRIRHETGLKLTAAVSPFVPKPGTPWDTADFAGEAALKGKYVLLSRAAKGLRGVEFQRASIREASLEYALSWASSKTSGKMIECVKRFSHHSFKNITGFVDRGEALSTMEQIGLLKI